MKKYNDPGLDGEIGEFMKKLDDLFVAWESGAHKAKSTSLLNFVNKTEFTTIDALTNVTISDITEPFMDQLRAIRSGMSGAVIWTEAENEVDLTHMAYQIMGFICQDERWSHASWNGLEKLSTLGQGDVAVVNIHTAIKEEGIDGLEATIANCHSRGVIIIFAVSNSGRENVSQLLSYADLFLLLMRGHFPIAGIRNGDQIGILKDDMPSPNQKYPAYCSRCSKALGGCDRCYQNKNTRSIPTRFLANEE